MWNPESFILDSSFSLEMFTNFLSRGHNVEMKTIYVYIVFSDYNIVWEYYGL